VLRCLFRSLFNADNKPYFILWGLREALSDHYTRMPNLRQDASRVASYERAWAAGAQMVAADKLSRRPQAHLALTGLSVGLKQSGKYGRF
jgi:hypothetical protein